ncbi:sorting nexin-25 [Cebidichthys violaceus]|uniref:sorting nexin-25 n=1 Tax=Cebidichthys violaceus TaxID=271503 RepID=UPI0035CBD71B
MSLLRLSIAITLGLVWCFSDCGRTLTLYCACFLFCFVTPLLFVNSGRESSTQTDEDTNGNPPQKTVEGELSGDLTDGESSQQAEESRYPHVKTSLQQVFECAYAQLVLPWYDVPEPRQQQPLHQVLSRELDFIIDRIIERAKDFDVRQAVVGCVRILTQHLHNAKQSDGKLLFSSRAEIAVLRRFSETLVRNLFPESLRGPEVNRCALNEIIALRGMGPLVTWLSDPDNLNQLVVSQLDSVTPKGCEEELCGSDPDQSSLASQEGEGEAKGREESLEGAGISTARIKTKCKANKLKEGWAKFVDKMKCKKDKMKKMEKEMRITWIQGDGSNEDDVSSGEGFVHIQQDFDGEDSDLEDYLTTVQEEMMEFKLSYEMWRVGRWAVSIPHAEWEDEELIFTVHLEEKGSPENLQWDIRKAYMEVVYFRNRWQDSTSLPTIVALEESEINGEVEEEAKASVEHFLQELVSDNLIGPTQPVFQFLCPLDKLLNEEEHNGGVWGLLSGLAYFLTPGQEEEESLSPQTEAPKEIIKPSLRPESAALPLENPDAFTEEGSEVHGASIPTIVISQYGSPAEWPVEAESPSFVHSDSSNGNCSQDKTEDSDNPLTSPFKMIFKGLTRSRSQESLVSTKNARDEDPPDSASLQHSCQNGDMQGSAFHFSARLDKIGFKMSGGTIKTRGKDQGSSSRGEDSQCQKSQVNQEQLEATKAIFDLLKEISGNSILINIFDAMLKPVMPILKKKVNSFLHKLNPTELQMAALIDTMRNKQWPDSQPAAPPPIPRTDEQKNETRERAQNLINARYSNYLVLKKTDVETVFNLFQNSKENKMLVYMLLSFLLREFLPNENSLNVNTAVLSRVTNSTN